MSLSNHPNALSGGAGLSSSSGLPPTNALQVVTTSLVSTQQSYVITFSPVMASVPRYVDPSVQMPNSTGESFFGNVDLSTITTTSCTVWLSGIPTAASTGGKLTVLAII